MTHQNPTTKPLSNYCGKTSGCGGFLPNALYEACVMSIIVEIKGRKALVVWTLPYVTSWRLSPDTLLERLASHSSNFLSAFNLDIHNIYGILMLKLSYYRLLLF